MPEENGTGRLDRIERLLELLVSDHEQFRQDLKQLLIAQVLMQDNLEKLQKRTEENTRQLEIMREKDRDQDRRTAALDERVDKLVIAIGEFLRSRPSPAS
jgi:hypothetical protein